MINLIEMNMTRLFMRKTIYVLLLIILFSFGGFAAIVLEDTNPIEQEMLDAEMNGAEAGEQFGMVISGGVEDGEIALESVYETLLLSGLLLMIIGIYSVGYCEDERRSGFLKNLTLGRNSKKYVFASKLVTVITLSFLVHTMALVGTACGMIIKDMFFVGSFALALKLLVYHTMLDTAFGIAMMAIYECIRKNVPVILFAVFGAFNAFTFFFSMLEDKLSAYISPAFFERFGLSQFLLEYRVHSCGLNAPVSTLIIALASIIIYTTLGCVVYTKRDVI